MLQIGCSKCGRNACHSNEKLQPANFLPPPLSLYKPTFNSMTVGMVPPANYNGLCCPFLGNFCQAFLWQTINNGTNWQLKMRSECMPFKWKTATCFKINLLQYKSSLLRAKVEKNRKNLFFSQFSLLLLTLWFLL